MTDTDKQPAMTYPAPEQYEGWKSEAEEMDMSVSSWIQAMVEAGRKKFDATVEPDESAQELREQRNDLKDELEHARERVAQLETRLHRGERAVVQEYVEANPGATYSEIVQHVADTVPERVSKHLEELEGQALHVDGDCYYPVEDGE